MVMMVGLPACGKTTWVEKYNQEHPEARFNVLGTNSIIDKMKVCSKEKKCKRSIFTQVAHLSVMN